MSTQYTDHDTLERVAQQRRVTRPATHPATRPAPCNMDPLDHTRLALEWLQREEPIPALRVVDPGRGRFSPWRETPDPDTPKRWTPGAPRNLDLERLSRDYRLLLIVYADWIIWRRPYARHE